VYQRVAAALATGEHLGVELFLQFRLARLGSGLPRDPRRLFVRGGGDDVGEGDGSVQTVATSPATWAMSTNGGQPTTAIRRKRGKLESWSKLRNRQRSSLACTRRLWRLDFVVIDQPGFSVDAVLHGVMYSFPPEQPSISSYKYYRGPGLPRNGVARLDQGKIHSTVGRRAEWLDVSVVGN